MNERKQRKWRVLGSSSMMEDLFTGRQRGTTAEDTCQVSHNEGKLEVEDGVRKCQHCRGFEELRRLLRDPTYLINFAVPEVEPSGECDWRHGLRAFGAEVWLVRQGDDVLRKPGGATAATVG